MPHRTRRTASALLRPLQLTAIFFFTVSGGPYGLEPLLRHAGPTFSFALLIITPLVWSVPVILMVLELNSLYPKEGGYYYWVKAGLGQRWGFFEGWWTWLYALTDLAIYPVLFTEYLTFLFPQAVLWRIPLCLTVIWISALINILGIQPVGKSSLVLKAAVVLPFLVLVGWTFFASRTGASVPTQAANVEGGFTSFSLAIFTVMWNYLGWDSASTIAEEVENPRRSYIKAMFAALAVIVVLYLAATASALESGISHAQLEDEGYPALGFLVGGNWLGSLIAVGGLASALGLFLSNLLAITRIPEVIALDGYLPARFARLHPRFRTPQFSIVACALIVSGMILWDFSDLLIIDVTLYSAALIPEFVALMRLRRSQPDAERPFRIPLGNAGLVCMTALPVLCLACAVGGVLTLDTTHGWALWFSLFLAVTAFPAWKFAVAMATRHAAREHVAPFPPAD